MDFSLSPEQEQWRKLARQFAQESMRPFADQWDAAGEFAVGCFRKAAELGFTGLFGPREFGGLSVDALTACLIYEELAQGCFATGFGVVVHNNFIRALARLGTKEAQEQWLRQAIRGELIGAFALTEPQAGSDAAAIQTTAVPERGGYRLNGVKAWVSNGGVAHLYNVMARMDAQARSRAISAFIVERDRAGVSFGLRDRKMGACALPTCRMVLEDVWVPHENLLGQEGEGLRSALNTIDLARAVVGVMATGLAQAALDAAIAYAKERTAFGQPVASFQGMQFLLADLASQVEASRWLAYRAAWLFDQGAPATKACAVAKRVGTEVAEDVCRKALEVFGAYGLLREHGVERYLRSAKVAAFLDGTTQIQQLVIARHLLR